MEKISGRTKIHPYVEMALKWDNKKLGEGEVYICVCVFKFLLFGTLAQNGDRSLEESNRALCERSPMGSHTAIKAQPLHMAAAAFGVLHLGKEGRQAALLIDAPFPP